MLMNPGFSRTCPPRQGFTLVEFTMVCVIMGVLAALGVPRLLSSVERSRAARAFTYLSAVRAAQERYRAREGTYAAQIDDMYIDVTPPPHFRVGKALSVGTTGSLADSWSLTLTREGAASGYGEYTVTFTELGYDPDNSTIDTLPAINPMGSDPGDGSWDTGS